MDQSQYPGQSDVSGKTAYLPANYAYAQTSSPKVNVPVNTPYKGAFYRERLVKDQQVVNMYLMALEPVGISSEVTSMERKDIDNSSLAKFKKMIRAQFGLDDLPISNRPARQDFTPRFSAVNLIKDAKLIEDIASQKIWQITAADGRDYTVDINVADDEHTAREVLVERLSKISNPDIIRNDPPVAGDISFTVAGQSVLFVRNNIAVTVFFGPQSKPLATAIDQQIMT